MSRRSLRQLGEMEREEQTRPNGAASVEHQQGKDDQTTQTGGEAPGVIPNERCRYHANRCHRRGKVEVVLSEYGCDLSRFPTQKHFVSNVTLAPHVPQNGGKPTKKKKRNKVRWRHQPYVDQAAAAYENRYRQQRITSLMPKAKELGYQLTPARA